MKDIEGNNIIVVREFDLKFLEQIEIPKKPVSKRTYLNAKKVIKRYEREQAFVNIYSFLREGEKNNKITSTELD